MAKAKQTTAKTTKKTARKKVIVPRTKAGKLADVKRKRKAGGGRKPFDGLDPELVFEKIENSMREGLSMTASCKVAGVSDKAVRRYLENEPELARYLKQLKGHVLDVTNNVLNEVIQEREGVKNIYDADGNKKQHSPTNRAVTMARFNKRSLDPLFAEKPSQVIMPIGQVNLPKEKMEAIDGVVDAWESNDPEPYDV